MTTMETDLKGIIKDFDAVLDMRAAVVRLVDEQVNGSSFLSLETSRHEETTADGRKLVVFLPNKLDALVKISTKTSALRPGEHSQGGDEPRTLDQGGQSPQRELGQVVSVDPGPSVFCDSEMYFVAFVGHKKPSVHEEDLPIKLWDADDGLKRDMSSIPEIMAYISCERTCGGDWSNLVIFTDRNVVEKWQASPLHTYLVNEFSPLFYSKVRIHRGLMRSGLRSETFCLERTLFLDYADMAANKPSTRFVKYWKNA